MRVSEMLNAIASWLENSDNEVILLSEHHEDTAKIVAESCVLAAALLKNAAEQVEAVEPQEPSKITPEAIEDLATLASAFDASGDPALKKQASVLDELLLSIAAPKNAVAEIKQAQEKKIDEIRKKYQEPREQIRDYDKVAEAEKAIENSGMTKEYKVLEFPLSTRTCPDHPGAQLARVDEHTWQCDLDKKIYNYDVGFELDDGSKVPGADVSNQSQLYYPNYTSLFDTREGRLGQNK